MNKIAPNRKKGLPAKKTNDRTISPFRHQRIMVAGPRAFPDLDWFILAGGYGCGKSFSIVLCILDIVKRYNGQDVAVGIGSITITLAKKTIWKDLESVLKRSRSQYTPNWGDNTLQIGTITFFFIAIEQPGNIYAYNLNIFLCDEIDELSQTKVLEANKAIRERTRIMLPDGRIPYIMYFTTVQGYRGLYQVVKKLKDSGEKFLLVRGLTKDNTTLAPSYVRSLYNIYDENERLAYLEGRFVNLRAGRVYPEYDEDACRAPYFEADPDEEVRIGQDLNSGFSKGCAIIKRGKTLYIHRGWSFEEIGQAPGIMRRDYPEQHLYWFPDTAGKEIIKGYKDDIIANGIECRIGTQNPHIITRVFYVNKLFKLGLLKVCDGPQTEEIREALKVRQYADNGQPEKGSGAKAPDHFCDALEYDIFRIVNSDPDYLDLRELSREYMKENGHLQIDARKKDLK